MTRRWTLIQPLLLLAVLIGLEGRASRADQIYWTDIAGGDIRRANLDGSGSQTLVSGLNQPAGIALDLAGGKMYWSDYGGGDIREANLDGSGSQTLVSGLSRPTDVALDLAGGKMYWADWGNGDIRRANPSTAAIRRSSSLA